MTTAEKRPRLFRHLLLVPALCAVAGSGCMSYEKPPVAVTEDSYTRLQEKEKTLLPKDLKVLTLEDAQRIALENNPDFKSIQFTIDSARARYYQSYSSYAPTVNAGMSVQQSFGRLYYTNTEGADKTRSQSENYSPTLSGQLLLFDCLAREMNVLAKKHALNRSQANVDDARRLLLRAVAYAYNDILLAEAQRKIAEAEIDYSRRMLKEAEDKYKVGTVLISDVYNFRITLRNGELALIQIDYNIKSGKYVLAGYLGLVDGTLPDYVALSKIGKPKYEDLPDISVYLDAALTSRPDLKGCREALAAARFAYYGAWSAMGPTVTADYSLGYAFNRAITRGGDTKTNKQTGNGAVSYGVSANWNLFNGFSDWNEIRASLAAVAQSDYALAQSWIGIITDVRTAYANYVSNVQQTVLSEEICQMTLETRNIVENEYKAGTALVTRLNEAESALIKAQNNYATAVINISNAKAQLDAAVYAGQPQTEPLKTHLIP